MLLHTLPVDVAVAHYRIVPAGSARHCKLDSANHPLCHASGVAYCKEFLSEILELLHILLAFGLLAKLHPGLPVPFEGHDLQALQEVELVRAENFKFPLDLHHRRPR